MLKCYLRMFSLAVFRYLSPDILARAQPGESSLLKGRNDIFSVFYRSGYMGLGGPST